MRRAPIVIVGTIAGLVGVLEFHTMPAKLALSGLQAAPAASAQAGPASAAGSSQHASSSSGAGSTPGAASKQKTGSQPSGTRSAVGPGVNYNFGVISVKVTVTGSKIVKIGIVSLNDGGNPRSQYIDGQAIPILEQEVMQAQSATIQGVSGASYTSAGFDQSLQAALHTLGFA